MKVIIFVIRMSTKIRKLNNKCRKYEEEIVEMRDMIETQKAQIEDYGEKIVLLKWIINEKDNKIRNLEEDLENKQTRIAGFVEEKKMLDSKLLASENRIKKLVVIDDFEYHIPKLNTTDLNNLELKYGHTFADIWSGYIRDAYSGKPIYVKNKKKMTFEIYRSGGYGCICRADIERYILIPFAIQVDNLIGAKTKDIEHTAKCLSKRNKNIMNSMICVFQRVILEINGKHNTRKRIT